MASALALKAKQSFLSQSPSIDLDTDTIKVCLINMVTDYTWSSAHDFIDDVTKYAGTTDQTLGSKTVTDGVFDAADSVFTAVAISGVKTVGGLWVYKDTGTPSTSPLIAFFDGFTVVTPNGGDITVVWDAGANRIFKL